MTGMIEDMTAHPQEAMRQALRKGHPTATDLADYLVAELNIPFRNAHHITGALVALAGEKGCGLEDLSLKELQSVEPQLTSAVQLFYPLTMLWQPEQAMVAQLISCAPVSLRPGPFLRTTDAI